MPLPPKLSVQTLVGIKDQPFHYETSKKIIDGQNLLIESLGTGIAVGVADFTLSSGWGDARTVTPLGGSTVKRGQFTVVSSGANRTSNPTIKLGFPTGAFTSDPFVVVTRNGGTGTLTFSWLANTQGVTITISGTPGQGDSYGFQYAARD